MLVRQRVPLPRRNPTMIRHRPDVNDVQTKIANTPGGAAPRPSPMGIRQVAPRIAAVLAVAGAVWMVYGRAIRSPFIFDDQASVLNNPSIVKLWPLWGDPQHPGPLNPPKDLATSGRPLVNLSLALNYHFGGFDPLGYHLFNLAVHVLSALLLMAIVSRTLHLEYFGAQFHRVSGLLALAVALLWALHPLQTETVVYVTQRTELLVGLFYLATIYGSLRYWDAATPAGRTTWLTLSILACLAGMACKEVMVSAPLIVLLFERTFIAGSFRSALQRSWPLYGGLLLSWVLAAWLNRAAPRAETAGFHLGVPAYVWWLTQTKVLWMYWKLAVWPWPLAIHYEMPYLTTLGAAWPWLLPTLLLGVATLILIWRRTAAGFVGACVLVILSPTLVVPIVTEVAAERRMYLPLAALVALMVVGGYWLARQVVTLLTAGNRGASTEWSVAFVATATMILALVLSLVSVHRLEVYHDPVTLWQDTLALHPDDDEAHTNFAAVLIEMRQWPEAIEHSQQALRLDPRNAKAHMNLGIALATTGQTQQAISHFQEARRLKPHNAEAHYNLGTALQNSGQEKQAIEQYRQALRLKPDYAKACNNLALALAHTGQPQQAIEYFQQAIQLRPDDADLYNNLGAILADSGHPQEAIKQYRRALQLAPASFELNFNLAAALISIGQTPDAIDCYRKALQLRPDHADAWHKLAIAYESMHDAVNARAAAQQALRLARIQGREELVGQIEAWLDTIASHESINQAAP